MLKKIYDKETKQEEWVDEGGANSKGMRDFSRYTRRQSSKLESLSKKFKSKSDYASKQYIKGIKGLSTRISRGFNEELNWNE